MSDVLVLNASYEPLHRVAWQRAITLVVQHKAVIDESVPDKYIRFANGQFPWPKVLRLLSYVKVPIAYGEETYTRMGVLRRDNWTCAYCGKRGDTVDHLNPQSRFPEQAKDWMNAVAACYPCNHKKGARTLQEAGLTLLFEPTVPHSFRRLRGNQR